MVPIIFVIVEFAAYTNKPVVFDDHVSQLIEDMPIFVESLYICLVIWWAAAKNGSERDNKYGGTVACSYHVGFFCLFNVEALSGVRPRILDKAGWTEPPLGAILASRGILLLVGVSVKRPGAEEQLRST